MSSAKAVLTIAFIALAPIGQGSEATSLPVESPVILKHPGEVRSARLSPDEKLLATCSRGGSLRFWDLQSGQLRREMTCGECYDVAFFPDGPFVAVSQGEGLLTLRNWSSGKQTHRFVGHAGDIFGLGIAADGKRIGSGGTDCAVRIWNSVTAQPVALLKGHSDTITRVAFCSDNDHVVSAGLDSTVRVWNIANQTESRQVRARGAIHDLALSLDGFLIVSAGHFGASMWEFDTGQLIWEDHLPALAACFSPDSSKFLLGRREIQVFDSLTMKSLDELDGHKSGVLSLSFFRDAKRLVSASRDFTVRIWDVERLFKVADDRINYSDWQKERLWTAMGDADAKKAYDAMCALCRANEGALFVGQKLMALKNDWKISINTMKSWITELGADDFRVRQEAFRNIEAHCGCFEQHIRGVYREAKDPEIRSRLKRVIRRLDDISVFPERLRVRRALVVLERSKTRESIECLKNLKSGQDEWLSRQTERILDRVTRVMDRFRLHQE